MNVVKYQTRIDALNIVEIIKDYDVVVDGVNFPTRYLLNDASVRLAHPPWCPPRSSASTGSRLVQAV